MTREEEIKLEADYSYEGNYKSLQKQCFIEGAMWADANPYINWQQVRIQAAVAAMQGLLACSETRGTYESFAHDSVGYADALVKELKGE